MTVFKSLLCVVLMCITGLLVALYPNAEPINKPLHESTSAEALIQDFSVNNTETTLANSLVKEKSKHPTDASTEHKANHNQHSNKQHEPATEEKAFVDDDAMSIEAFLQQDRHRAMVTKELVDVSLEQALARLKDVPEFMLREVPGLKDRPPTNKDYSATNFPISPVYLKFPTVPRAWYDSLFFQGNFEDYRAKQLTKHLSKWVASTCPHLDTLYVKCSMTACEIDLSPIKGLDLTGKGWWSHCYIPNYLRSIGYKTRLRQAIQPRHYRQEIYSFHSEYY